ISATGIEAGGALAPAGWEVVVGSFIFGIGMQLASGCGSGTLFTVGGGSVRMVVTLLFFCFGAFLATLAWDLPAWTWLRQGSRTVSLGREFGWGVATMGQLALLGVIWMGLGRWGRGRKQKPIWTGGLTWRRLLSGPWPLLLSAVLLALLNWLVLEITGHAWSIVWGFTLWAAEAAQALGWDPLTSTFWAGRATFLARGVFLDDTSITDMGIILGALLAAGLAGRFEPTLKIPAKSLLAAVIGGLLLGIGARMAYGCNIGAFFSGVASSSLHGWIWIVGALAGNWLGVQFRPAFGLEK
ncbi:MAG: YeeE/YedE family protein, partial [Alphaproteobacteria bacterium]|nr:YeeE/YedE family protein [Alphaproteobacteria bacterium]